MIVDILSIGFSTVFFFVIVSYYVLAIIPARRYHYAQSADPITILIPARNEECVIADTIRSVLNARWLGEKHIIVIDDASEDATSMVASDFNEVTVMRNDTHRGKSRSLNRGLEATRSELVCVVDGDSTIERDALEAIVRPFSDARVGASTSIIGVRNRNRLPNPFVHIELLYNSLVRAIQSKVNGNVVTPGPLSCYRRQILEELGGFPTDVYSEDIDLTVRIIRSGYTVAVAENAKVNTVMPTKPREFARQRLRFSRGIVFIFRRHLTISKRFIDFYTIPLLVFTYLQSTIMGAITVVKIAQGLGQFAGNDVLGIARFLLDWFTMSGIIRWAFSVLSGTEPVSAFVVFGLLSSALTYPLYLLAVARYDRFAIRDMFAIVFLPLFWLSLSVFYILAAAEVFVERQENRWKKNEQ